MSDDRPPPQLDDLVERLLVAPLPLSALLAEGRARRRRALAVTTAGAAVLVSVATGAALGAIGGRDDAAPGPTVASVSPSTVDDVVASARVERFPISSRRQSNTALWDRATGTLVYVTTPQFGGDCQPIAAVSRLDDDVTLQVSPQARSVATCDGASERARVDIRGLTAPPDELTVAEAGDVRKVDVYEVDDARSFTRTVDVSTSGATGEASVELHRAADPNPLYVEDARVPWQSEWPNLMEGDYLVTAADRACEAIVSLTGDATVAVAFQEDGSCSIDVAGVPPADGLIFRNARPEEIVLRPPHGSGEIHIEAVKDIFLGVDTCEKWTATPIRAETVAGELLSVYPGDCTPGSIWTID